MARIDVASTVADVPQLRGLFITAMPDCLLFGSWVREGETWHPEDVAAYFGDLIRANREGLKALGSWSALMQVTIESADVLIILRELEGDFVAGFVFSRETPLGMVRLHIKRMTDRLQAQLPAFQVQERPRAVRVLEFLQRYAPDPHASLLRVSLQTGVPLETLARPEALAAEQLAAVERSIADILGIDELHL